MIYDLHTHSYFSDGTLSPEQLIEEAVKINAVLALTDHNTAAGLPRFMKAAADAGLDAVSGVELSSDYNGCELHILGLFIDESRYEEIDAFCEDYKRRKEDSNREMLARLNSAGYDISFDTLKDNSLTGSFNRAIVAAAMMEKGYVSSIDEAFRGILRKNGGYYTAPSRKNAIEVISFVKSVGAIPVLAHPLISADEVFIDRFLPEAIEAGLRGIETRYSLYDENQNEAAHLLAEKYHLLESGGSDFHGNNKPSIMLGTGKGTLSVPESFYTGLYNFSKTSY